MRVAAPPLSARPTSQLLTAAAPTGSLWAMQRGDINEYANTLLLDFLDAVHSALQTDLQAAFGDDWFAQGVQRHLHPDYFSRTREMLESPMKVVDMGKTDEELYGVEHLWNIIAGNWKAIYQQRLHDRSRTEACLSEIAEIRHNVSHRRRRHFLRRAELIRFAQNCCMILRGVGSSESRNFDAAVESLSTGSTPWGPALGGYIPPADEVVDEFIGRPNQLRDLTAWLGSDSPQLLVWGYGGAGKSALAYEFARETRDISPPSLNAVCWISAKRLEYVDGKQRPKRADFVDARSVVPAIFNAIFETDLSEDDLSAVDLLQQLRELPILLIVDDFDTVLADEDTVEFLMHDVRTTGTKVLYTSRQKVTGLRSIEVLGFEGTELEEFVRLRAFDHGLDPEAGVKRLSAIQSVTGGFPLFVDDLLRYAKLAGIDSALQQWSQRKGDAAREYALRRQLEQLGSASRDVLMALTVSDRALTTLELSTLAGITDDDAEHAISSLLDWRLINRVVSKSGDRPSFAMNPNTRRLVQRTYGNEPEMEGLRAKFRVLGSQRVPAARAAAIGSAIGVARSLVIRGDPEAAVEQLKARMTGELSDSADLYGALGWALSRKPAHFLDDARAAFEHAYELGNTKEDTYYHWSTMELEAALAAVGHIPDATLVSNWRRSSSAAERGIKVSGSTRALCYLAAYARAREAKTLERLNEFTQAQGRYADASTLFRSALAAPPSQLRDVSRDVLYRGLVLSLEGSGDLDQLCQAMIEWESIARSLDPLRQEVQRLTRSHPELESRLPDIALPDEG